MVTHQLTVRGVHLEEGQLSPLVDLQPDLLFVFAPVHLLNEDLAERLRAALPGALQLGCSTCGEISAEGVSDDAVVLTGLRFDAPGLRGASTHLTDVGDSFAAGQRLAAALLAPGLHAVVVLGQGVGIDGGALVRGLQSVLGPAVLITGGLAGDNGAFVRTLVLYEGVVNDCQVAAVGFCGDRLRVTGGAQGGWRPFGPVRRVTRAVGSQLYTLDDQPALGVYKRYLGEHAERLPASALLFPLAVLTESREDRGLVRTILSVDEAEGSIRLAGAVDEGTPVRLMHASSNSLIEGAQAAAVLAHRRAEPSATAVALLVSCVGRRIVLGGRVEEELEVATEVFGPGVQVLGFYSHGEISPLGAESLDCHLNNQTMSITWIQEL